MSQQDIQEIEVNMRELQEMIDLGKSLERLLKNRDFKRVIEKEYLREEAIRLVQLKADYNMQSEQGQKRVLRDIDAIGSFTGFLDLIRQKAEAAQEAFNECEDTIAELEQESAE